jgi:hypothetical protein
LVTTYAISLRIEAMPTAIDTATNNSPKALCVSTLEFCNKDCAASI